MKRITTVHRLQASTAPGCAHSRDAGPSTANDCLESITMTNPIESRPGRQAAAALAIAKMCEHELPEITNWRITGDAEVCAEGQLAWCDGTESAMAALEEWRVYLKAGQVETRRYERSRSGVIEVLGSYHGPAGLVRVRIWDGVDAAALRALLQKGKAS